MSSDCPFHEGELRVQRRLGELDEARRNGRAITSSIVRGAFRFVAQQPFAVVATRGSTGSVRASVLYGEPGLAQVPDEHTVLFDLALLATDPLAPWLEDLRHDPRLGILFLEPETRRRLRVNGRVDRSGQVLRVDVREAYPNCPKYIQSRRLVQRPGSGSPPNPAPALLQTGVALGGPERTLVTGADTLFVASANPHGELDASHRGGPPGFVELLDGRTLRIPDYAGNHMYNTLGNFVLDPHAGVTFIDFRSGRTLVASGRASILHDVADGERGTGGTGRFWQLELEEWSSWHHPAQPVWSFVEASPFHPRA